jgi:dipeptidyl aminopeptidase/acylaminoacyl peptidase
VPAETQIAPSLAWIPGAALQPRELVWVSRTGAATSLDLDLAPGYLRWPRLAPDGRRLALGSIKKDEPGGAFGGVRIGVIDLQTRRLTWLAGFSEPVWSADGRRVVTSLGPDPGGLRYALPGDQRGGRLSPDSTWLAYQTTQGDRTDVHVVSFPALDRDYTVSADGGEEPAWSPDGKELCYRRGADVMRVTVPVRGETVSWPAPEVLFSGSHAYDDVGDQSYDVAPDGRFLMMRPRENGGVTV